MAIALKSEEKGHYVMGVFEREQEKILIVGVYGRSDNADREAEAILREMIEEIQRIEILYGTRET